MSTRQTIPPVIVTGVYKSSGGRNLTISVLLLVTEPNSVTTVMRPVVASASMESCVSLTIAKFT